MLMDLAYKNEDKEEGFSLVELLVVIVIIGILSAIAIGVFMNQRKKANNAALQSDMRTVANAYSSYAVDHSIDDLKALTGNGYSAWIYGDEAERPSIARVYWNDFEELPKITVSDHNAVEIIVIHDTSRPDTWNRLFDEGEFCLVGTGEFTDWNYGYDGITGHANYNKLLFWDAKLGGLSSMDDLVEATNDGVEISCSGHVERYMAATP